MQRLHINSLIDQSEAFILSHDQSEPVLTWWVCYISSPWTWPRPPRLAPLRPWPMREENVRNIDQSEACLWYGQSEASPISTFRVKSWPSKWQYIVYREEYWPITRVFDQYWLMRGQSVARKTLTNERPVYSVLTNERPASPVLGVPLAQLVVAAEVLWELEAGQPAPVQTHGTRPLLPSDQCEESIRLRDQYWPMRR